MSRKVEVNFESLSIEMQVKCDYILGSLCQINKSLDKIIDNSSLIVDNQINEYKNQLIKEKNNIQQRLNSFREGLELYKKNVSMYGEDVGAYEGNLKSKLNASFNKFKDEVSEFTSIRLPFINSMINEKLKNKIDEMQSTSNYDLTVLNKDLVGKVNNISDVSLRDLAFIELKNGNRDYDDIIIKAKKRYEDILNGSEETNKLVEQFNKLIKKDKNIVSKKPTVEEIKEMQKAVDNSIIDESIRKATLKSIIASIRKQGFIVDTKKNLKINKESNIVSLTALKPDGKVAKFEISLDGKFVYDFDGYEGQACGKNIEPFLEDMENIYGIKIVKQNVIRSNPDKITSQKYQYMKVNKNNG